MHISTHCISSGDLIFSARSIFGQHLAETSLTTNYNTLLQFNYAKATAIFFSQLPIIA